MEMKWTITAGELLQCLTILFGGFAIYNRLSLKIEALEIKIKPLWDDFLSAKKIVS